MAAGANASSEATKFPSFTGKDLDGNIVGEPIVGAISSAEQCAALDKPIDRRLRDAALPCPFLGKGSVILRKEFLVKP